VSALDVQDGTVCAVELRQDGEGRRKLPCRGVVLATGGASYPATGSTGDGYELAQSVGHSVVPPKPSLVPLEAEEDFCGEMQGLALKNVTLRMKDRKGKVLFQEQGELLFTHFGLSGPLILSASAHLRDFEKNTYRAVIDLKPALDEEKLDARLLRELGDNANKDMQNVMGSLVPRLMVPVALRLADIPLDRKAHDVTRGERRRLLETLKGLTIHIKGPRPIAEAIVTSGGVKVGEIDPRTMQSKKLSGLFLAGELIDVDAYTGGFNLQIAWATGRAAGVGASAFLAE
ncbi:MAG: aminoacetone oxidase family FAD-binding enzyme, partial [Oscillospiraceae bacterium]|nr:aminoacetone oxidase family FAD-binding enzyme [Oscillospiraceae bacterium]